MAASATPNILIMGDDIGWFNIGAYHRGIMAGRTSHIDKLASEGTLLTIGHLPTIKAHPAQT